MADIINLADRREKVRAKSLVPDEYKSSDQSSDKAIDFIDSLAMTCPECGSQSFYVMIDKAGAKNFGDLLGSIVQFDCANPDCGVVFLPDEEKPDGDETL